MGRRAQARLRGLSRQLTDRSSLEGIAIERPLSPATERSAYLGVSAPDIGEDEIAEIVDCIRSGWVTTGPRVARLEEDLTAYLQAPAVRCLNSCTAALYMALRLLEIGPGDEVLVPTMTFAACPNAVVHAGATPVFVDSAASTGLVDLAAAEAAITPRTRALMIVHLGGRPHDMDAVNALSRRTGIPVIEDAAHAIGAEWDGRRIGGFGNLTAFSFHASKNMTTFDGGALAVADAATAERVGLIALQGLDRSAWERHGDDAPAVYDIVLPGFKLTMHDVAAAVGIHQLARLDARIEHQGRLAQVYDEHLQGSAIGLEPALPDGARHAHHLYAVAIPRGIEREAVVAQLHSRGIGTSVHFRALHLHSYYRDRFALTPDQFPIAQDRSERMLSLPLHPKMDESDAAWVAAELLDAIASS